MEKRRRNLALGLCAGLALILLLTSVCILHGADHDCTGEGCAVCAAVAGAWEFLRGFTLLGAAAAPVCRLLPRPRRCPAAAPACAGRTVTPVERKVRMND